MAESVFLNPRSVGAQPALRVGNVLLVGFRS
jgi:hypothetical protein